MYMYIKLHRRKPRQYYIYQYLFQFNSGALNLYFLSKKKTSKFKLEIKKLDTWTSWYEWNELTAIIQQVLVIKTRPPPAFRTNDIFNRSFISDKR